MPEDQANPNNLPVCPIYYLVVAAGALVGEDVDTFKPYCGAKVNYRGFEVREALVNTACAEVKMELDYQLSQIRDISMKEVDEEERMKILKRWKCVVLAHSRNKHLKLEKISDKRAINYAQQVSTQLEEFTGVVWQSYYDQGCKCQQQPDKSKIVGRTGLV